MSEKPENETATTEAGEAGNGENGAAGQAPDRSHIKINVLGQYIKDLSFESPNAPKVLQGSAKNPRLEVSVNVNAGGIGKDVFEVALSVEAHAQSDEGTVYNIELIYAGIFRMEDVAQARLQSALFVDCPSILFPFARRLVADLSRDGGFPPLMLDPIDFGMLYQRNLANAQQEASHSSKN